MPSQRVLVLFEPGRGGAAALDFARELTEHDHATLTVLSVVPHAPSGSRCGNSALEYNQAIMDAAAEELRQARERLGELVGPVTFELLVEGMDPPLHDRVASGGFDVVLLPARRRPMRGASHPAAAALRRSTSAQIRIVDPRAQPAPSVA